MALQDGTALIAGGLDVNTTALASAETYSPATGTFALSGSMTSIRAEHAVSLLATGQALIVGGVSYVAGSGMVLDSAELYDPSTRTFSATGAMNHYRDGPGMALLGNGQVLVVGGGFAVAELYTP